MIVIGDVHGCYNTLLALIAQLPKDSDLCFVGDLIDRGPDSKKVLDFVIEGKHQCVLGNHELMMLDAFKESHSPYVWLNNGGWATICSLQNAPVYPYLQWMETLPLTVEVEPCFIISHANAAYSTADPHDVACNRDFESTFEDKINIFGHTPWYTTVLKKDKLICVDTGCCNNGYLSAYDTDTGKIYTQKCIDRNLV